MIIVSEEEEDDKKDNDGNNSGTIIKGASCAPAIYYILIKLREIT